jgi:hypothetical protein
MKYLKSFNENLNSTSLSKSDVINILQNNCKKFLNYPEKNIMTLIFRKESVIKDDFVLVDPKSSSKERIAPFSSANYHNLVISNLESWKDWPRRNKSLICSGYDRARSHTGSNFYVVIPFDDTVIATCITSDFWDSFTEIKLPINDYFIEILDRCDFVGDDRNWNKLKYFLETHEPKKDVKKDFFKSYNDELSLLENINIQLEPNKNGFIKGDIANTMDFYKTGIYESWMEDKVLLIKRSLLDEILSEIN